MVSGGELSISRLRFRTMSTLNVVHILVLQSKIYKRQAIDLACSKPTRILGTGLRCAPHAHAHLCRSNEIHQ